jgi:hypothetical protein
MHACRVSSDNAFLNQQENGDSPGEGSAPEAAGESVPELKAKLARIKRQALAFKGKAAEAGAARDAALQQLAALQVPDAHCTVSHRADHVPASVSGPSVRHRAPSARPACAVPEALGRRVHGKVRC